MRTKIIIWIFLIAQVLTVNSQEFTWATAVSGENFEYGTKTIRDTSGNVYSIGYTTDSSFEYEGNNYPTNGEGDVFFAKFDSSKNLVWMKAIGGNDPVYFDEALDIHLDPFGDIYLSILSKGANFKYDGQVLNGINSIGQYGGEAVLIKVKSNGNYVWHESGTLASSFDAVTTDMNGNVYVTGNFTSSVTLGGGAITLNNPSSYTTQDLLVAKYQPNGTIIWAKNAGGMPHNTFAYGNDIEFNPQSNEVVVLGRGDGEVYFDGVPMPVDSGLDEASVLISYETDGTQKWVKKVMDGQNSRDSHFSSLAISSSGIIGVCGNIYSDGLVGFFNEDGSIISERQHPSVEKLRFHSITFNEFDEAYLSGRCETDGTIGSGSNKAFLSATTGFIVKMDLQQQVNWVTEFTPSHFGSEIFYDKGIIMYGGRIDSNFTYNSGQDVIVNQRGDALFGEVKDIPLSLESNSIEDIVIYPNPTSGKLIINSDTLKQVEIFNISGMLVETTNKNKIDLSKHSEGVYLLKIYTNKGTNIEKIVLK